MNRLGFLAAVLATWVLVDAVKAGGMRALDAAQAQPTPVATPNLAAAVYAHIQPSVVQVIANGSSPAGAVVGEVISSTFLGSTSRVRVLDDTGSRSLTADLSTVEAAQLTVGTRVIASFPPDAARLLSLAEQEALPVLDPDNP